MKKLFVFSQVVLALCIVCSCSDSSDDAKNSDIPDALESVTVIVNGHKFVDLGLPSGLLWAETNVGASSASDDGDYFAWGETEPKDDYSLETYKWGNPLSKYNTLDGKTYLDSEDDVATDKWGMPCRMPSSSDFEELYSKCVWTWTFNYNGASGYFVKGPNGNTIFFSASGNRSHRDSDSHSNLYYHGKGGYYWSRSLRADSINFARYFSFGNGYVYPANFDYRYLGFLIRPVADR